MGGNNAAKEFKGEPSYAFKVIFNDFVKDDAQAFVKHFIDVDPLGEIKAAGLLWVWVPIQKAGYRSRQTLPV